MQKKHMIIFFLIALCVVFYSFYHAENLSAFLTDLACVVTIFTGVMVVVEIFYLRDISVHYTNTNGKPSKFRIKNRNNSELNVRKLVMVLPKYRLVLDEYLNIESGDSLDLMVDEESGFYQINHKNRKFVCRENELVQEIISGWGKGKFYFELHTDKGLYIPQYGTLSLISRAIRYLKSKFFNKRKVEIIIA